MDLSEIDYMFQSLCALYPEVANGMTYSRGDFKATIYSGENAYSIYQMHEHTFEELERWFKEQGAKP